MTEKKEPKQEPRQEPIGTELANVIEPVALEIYKAKTSRGFRGMSPEVIAQQAFAEAAVFANEAMRIRSGGAIVAVAQEHASPMVMVDLWDILSTGPLIDEMGNQVSMEMQGDHGACAPNLSPEHPINQRYWKARLAMGMEIPEKGMRQAADDFKRRQRDTAARN